jgi:hypothetical protein
MTLIKKRDVAAHFAARRRKPGQIHFVSAVQPVTPGLPAKEPVQAHKNPLNFDKDFVSDHSSSRAALKPDSKALKAPPPEAAFGRGSL